MIAVRWTAWILLLSAIISCRTGSVASQEEAQPPPGKSDPQLFNMDGSTGIKKELKLPIRSTEQKQRPKAKGIYVSGWAAGTKKLDRLIELVDQTELNALVIDGKRRIYVGRCVRFDGFCSRRHGHWPALVGNRRGSRRHQSDDLSVPLRQRRSWRRAS